MPTAMFLMLNRSPLPPRSPAKPQLARMEVLPGAGHWIQQERAEAVNALLLDFLAGSTRGIVR